MYQMLYSGDFQTLLYPTPRVNSLLITKTITKIPRHTKTYIILFRRSIKTVYLLRKMFLNTCSIYSTFLQKTNSAQNYLKLIPNHCCHVALTCIKQFVTRQWPSRGTPIENRVLTPLVLQVHRNI